jgi:transposase
MYVRRTQRRKKDGTTTAYLALAHNERVNGVSSTRVLVNFGREDQLDPDALRRLVSSLTRYLGDPDPYADDSDADPGQVGLTVTESRSVGGVWLLDALWHELGIDTALREVLGGRRFTTDVERVLFALVANRALDPCSKLAAAEWVCRDVAVPGLEFTDEDQGYRAMDLLVEADTCAQVQEQVFFKVANLFNLKVDIILFDTTSTYFERDTPDADPETGEPGLRRYGHSKDHRSDLPQIIIGLAVTSEGIPVRCWVWPGNTSDTAVLPEVRDGMRDWNLGRVITIVDRGFSSNANLDYLHRGGGGWIAGEKMRDGSADAAEALARPGRYTTVNDHLRVKEVHLASTPGVRWIVCANLAQAAKDNATRDAAVVRLEAELERIGAARTRAEEALAKATAKKTITRLQSELAGHNRAECALREHRTLGRYLRQLPSGRLTIDRAAVNAEAKLDGKYLLSTSDQHLSPAEVALAYKNLLEVERGFRDLKSTLMLRPVFHRLEHRIRAHVLICWLALLLVRVAEQRTETTWNRIAAEMDRQAQVTLAGPAGTVIHTTVPTPEQSAIYQACQATPPPRIITANHT